MKQFTFIFILFISVFSTAQNTGVISGNVFDTEENNAPLMLAKVTILETGDNTLSDENGNFILKNLKEGTYTLELSFVGYQTQTLEIKILKGKTNIVNSHLMASTISLNDLVSVVANADKKETASISDN